MPWVVAAQADHPAVRRQPSNDRICQAQQQSLQYLAMTADRKRPEPPAATTAVPSPKKTVVRNGVVYRTNRVRMRIDK